MAAKTGTYTLISSANLSGTSQVDFTSIPATYTDLVIIVNGAVAASLQNMNLQFNSDTSANYSRTFMSGTGSATDTGRESSTYTYITLDRYGYFSTTQTTFKIDIFDYANTTTYKTVLSRSNGVDGTGAVIGLWRATPAAINRFALYLSGSTWTTGSTAKLYGIEAAK
jgi:hypothetical protein